MTRTRPVAVVLTLVFLVLLAANCGSTPAATGKTPAATVAPTEESVPAFPTSDPASTPPPSPVDVAMEYVQRLEGVPLARVGGEEVTWEDYEYGLRQALFAVSRQSNVDWSDPAMQQRLGSLQNQVLQQTVDRWLVRRLAAQEGIVVTDEALDAKLREEKARVLESDVAVGWDAFLDSMGLTEESYRQLLYDTELVMRLMAAQEVETTSDQVHIAHILLGERETGEKALAELKAGRSFADVASEYSKDEQTKDAGGDLGWFTLETMLPSLKEAASSLEPGQFSGVLSSQYGYAIILVHGREVRPAEPTLVSSRQQQALFAAVDIVRANTPIEYLVDFAEVEG